MSNFADKIIDSRSWMMDGWSAGDAPHTEEEGGCGVTGFACSIPVRGQHIYEPSVQMHNRGNGKGGGIAAVGLVPEQLGVSRDILTDDYILQIAMLDPSSRNAVEADFVTPMFDIHHVQQIPHVDDFRDIEGLDVCPPEIVRYFVRVKLDVLRDFTAKTGLGVGAKSLPTHSPGQDSGTTHGPGVIGERDIEDEFVYQNSFQLNSKYYAALGDKQAFVMSHGRDQVILKIVGYAEKIVQYYQLEDFKAHVWIAHQRYPTRGRVWHPGGAHPFCGMNEALVHNGDFANYYSVTEYLAQRNIRPLFLTDTEVSVLVFDLWNRVYRYPLEYIIEGLAPTAERDFDMLPKDKQHIYRRMQAAHIHASPDGPWFFIIARNNIEEDAFQLLGITDTAMLRPQVFAIQDGEVQIGLVCSEKQAIDATLSSLSKEDPRFCPIADDYWNARGGSYTDGGAFVFSLKRNDDGTRTLSCRDKFGRERTVKQGKRLLDCGESTPLPKCHPTKSPYAITTSEALFDDLVQAASADGFDDLLDICSSIASRSLADAEREASIEGLTLALDRRYATGGNTRSSILYILNRTLRSIFEAAPSITADANSKYARIDWETREALRAPTGQEHVLIVNAHGFPPEGDDCDARVVVGAYNLGWRRFICYDYTGQRFLGCGFGPESFDCVIDAYGSTGDYLASGLDGATVIVHGNAQDQVAQILKRGRLVVHGDVGQTFMYGAKGGDVFVKGNAAGRPLINAVGKPRAIINGTCLDFLAESFMAGDPLTGGGFVILNGVRFDDDGNVADLETPYSGSNLFSLASGGAIYVRDPHKLLDNEQLNGGEYRTLTDADWKVIQPYLEENEKLFGIPVSRLLTVDGSVLGPKQVYRKVAPMSKEAGHADDDANTSIPPCQGGTEGGSDE